jgi:tRNA threonylcarbamoyladenosine biosynthesis protein TsaE
MTSLTNPDSISRRLESPEATFALGQALGARLGVGDAVLLFGPLGAGKTTLARGAIAAWTGVDEDGASPTYTLVHVHEGPRGALHHMDLYRLTDPEEAEELGLDDALMEGPLLIEWPERLPMFRPADRLELMLAHEDGARRVRIAAFGRWKDRLHDL